MNAQTSPSSSPVLRFARGALLAGGVLAAFAASAGTGELAGQTVHGILGFFADPENVRGVFGAAAGALASVIAARPLNRGGSGPGSDDL
jgi:branched-subunit amino acid ABC-type transport system permease component